MPRYAVFLEASGHRMGVLVDKVQKELFLNQRNKDSYIIIKLNEDDFDAHMLNELKSEEANEIWGGYVLFPQEEEMMLLSIDQYILEIYDVFKKSIELLPYFKFNDSEKEIVNEFLFSCFQKLKIAKRSELCEDDGWEDIEYTDYLNMEFMAKYFIGGR